MKHLKRKQTTLIEEVATISKVSISFGNVTAIEDVSIQIRKGEIYGLIGPDGAGKTTLIRMMAGALDFDSGSITITGLDISKQADQIRERIGYMPQSYGLYTDLTVEENLLFFARLFGVPKFRMSNRISELLDFVRLSEFRNRRAGNLSGGMYKKLAIACSILHEPQLLLLDEPTNGVDPVSRRDLWALLFSLVDNGVSVFVSTPYMDEAERCHRVGFLYQGELVSEGEPAELLNKIEGQVFVYTCKNPSTEITKIRSLLPDSALSAVQSDGIRIILREPISKIDSKLSSKLKVTSPNIEDLLMIVQAESEDSIEAVQ
ncbi:MAG: ABC transporter ATP-binding protein [Leptonema sp. (in: Bacteria)]|nr:ABC transporter ATP-binding protein [Leptonema sp. (in: bacteria)]